MHIQTTTLLTNKANLNKIKIENVKLKKQWFPMYRHYAIALCCILAVSPTYTSFIKQFIFQRTYAAAKNLGTFTKYAYSCAKDFYTTVSEWREAEKQRQQMTDKKTQYGIITRPSIGTVSLRYGRHQNNSKAIQSSIQNIRNELNNIEDRLNNEHNQNTYSTYNNEADEEMESIRRLLPQNCGRRNS